LCNDYVQEELEKGNTFDFPEEWEEFLSPSPPSTPTNSQDCFTWVSCSDINFIIPPPTEFCDDIPLDKSISNERQLAIIHSPNRTDNQTPSTEIHSPRKHPIGNQSESNIRDKCLLSGIPHTCSCTRTIIAPDISSPDFFVKRQPEISNHIVNKHIQSDCKTKDLHNTSNHPQTPTNNDGDTGRKRKFSGVDIQDNKPGTSSHYPSRNKGKQRRISPRGSTGNKSLGSRSDRDNLPPPSTNTGDIFGENNHNGTDNNSISYTFILHKTGYTSLPPTSKKPRH
jgi:hypothetical protein